MRLSSASVAGCIHLPVKQTIQVLSLSPLPTEGRAVRFVLSPAFLPLMATTMTERSHGVLEVDLTFSENAGLVALARDPNRTHMREWGDAPIDKTDDLLECSATNYEAIHVAALACVRDPAFGEFEKTRDGNSAVVQVAVDGEVFEACGEIASPPALSFTVAQLIVKELCTMPWSASLVPKIKDVEHYLDLLSRESARTRAVRCT